MMCAQNAEHQLRIHSQQRDISRLVQDQLFGAAVAGDHAAQPPHVAGLRKLRGQLRHRDEAYRMALFSRCYPQRRRQVSLPLSMYPPLPQLANPGFRKPQG